MAGRMTLAPAQAEQTRTALTLERVLEQAQLQ